MCGIAGFLEFGANRRSDEAAAVVQAMTGSLIHRGPDGEGTWVGGRAGTVALGHRRLSIVDLSPTGAQPMASHSERYRIAFNGEIYNHRQLRLALGGIPFRGTSDTEVLLGAIEQWGLDETLSRAIGMFAFALWDSASETLHLARDRLGEKPLYWGIAGRVLLFGSELKALRTFPEFPFRVDRQALSLYLRYGYVPAPLSIYDRVYKLYPGTVLSVPLSAIAASVAVNPHPAKRAAGRLCPHPYWSAEEMAEHALAEQREGDPKMLADELERTLRSVIREQMVADVEVGAFLSGGIDSSTVVALMQAESRIPVKTFTVGFDDKAFDEADHARAIAAHLGTEHTEVFLSAEQARDVIPSLAHLYDEPFANPASIPSFMVAAAARKKVAVALSGDGGDELFVGYNRYLAMQRLGEWMRHIPRPFRRGLSRLILATPQHAWDRMLAVLERRSVLAALTSQSRGARVHKLAVLLGADAPEDAYRALISYATDPLVHNAQPYPFETIRSGYRLVGGQDRMLLPEQLLLWDLISYLPDDNLAKVDRASMATSLETRLPLLDRRVVELAWRLPGSVKVREGESKWLLRQVLYRHVPRHLVERPKMGFSVPVSDWLRGPLREWAGDLLSEARLYREGYLDVKRVARYWKEHLQQRRDRGLPLWALLMFQQWQDEWA